MYRSDRPSKYGSRKITTATGETFDSVKEYSRWCELRLEERAGVISGLRRQVKYELIPRQKLDGKVVEQAVTYIADFVYNKNGKTVVEDVKGYKKGQAYAVFVLKRKLMLHVHGIRVMEV